MKKEVIEIEVQIDSLNDAKKGLKGIGAVINEQKKITIEFEEELIRLERQLEKTPKTHLGAQRDLKIKINNLKDAIKEQRVAVKGLTLEQAINKKSTIKSTKSYFQTNEALTDLNRLTHEYALRLKGIRNIIIGSYQASVKFIKGLSGIKKALLTTGVGAIVVALGVIVAYWDEISEFIGITNEKLKKQGEFFDRNKQKLDGQLSILQEQEKLLTLQGKPIKENIKNQEKVIENLLLQNEAIVENLKLQLEVNKQKNNELSLWNKIVFAFNTVKGTDLKVKIGSEEAAKDLAKVQKQLDDAKTKTIQLKEALINLKKPTKEEQKKIDDENALADSFSYSEFLRRGREFQIKKEENSKENQDQALADLEAFNQMVEDEEFESESRRLKIQVDSYAARQLVEENYRKAKVASEIRLVNAIAGLAGQETAIGKALLIAKQLILAQELIINIKSTLSQAKRTVANTSMKAVEASAESAAGLTKTAAAAPFPANIPLILGYAAQAVGIISAVKSALSKTKEITSKYGAGGGVSQIQAPAPQIQTPSFNIVGSGGQNQLAQAIAGQTNQPIQAFVVSSEVTTAQELDRNIVKSSSLG